SAGLDVVGETLAACLEVVRRSIDDHRVANGFHPAGFKRWNAARARRLFRGVGRLAFASISFWRGSFARGESDDERIAVAELIVLAGPGRRRAQYRDCVVECGHVALHVEIEGTLAADIERRLGPAGWRARIAAGTCAPGEHTTRSVVARH